MVGDKKSFSTKSMEPVFDIAKNISVVQFNHHMRVEDAEVNSSTLASISAINWTVQILIVGSDMEVILRLHFSMATAEKMLANRSGSAYVTQNLALDLIRELSNLVSGRFKALLESAGILMAQGLPIVLEHLAGESNFPLTATAAPTCIWGLTSNTVGDLICSMTVQIENPKVLSALARVSLEDLPESGEVELF